MASKNSRRFAQPLVRIARRCAFCSARCVLAFMPEASSISAAARSVDAVLHADLVVDVVVSVGGRVGGADRPGVFVAHQVLQVGERVLRLRALALGMRVLEVRDGFVQLVGGRSPAPRASPAR